MIVNNQVHVDHILPYSRTLDDSEGNKLLSTLEANRQKKNRAPHEVVEWRGRFDEILARASVLKGNKRWRFAEDAMERFEGERDFLARQLTDTQYVSRVALTYLSSLYAAEEADRDGVLRRHSRVRALPGKMTEMLRRNWSLNELLPDHNYADPVKKKNRFDHRHNAIDAIVAACTTRSLIQKLAAASARLETEGAERIAADVPHPWPTFRDDVRAAMNGIEVSHKQDHGTVSRQGYVAGRGQTAGRLHNDTAYGLDVKEKGEGWVVRRKSITSFKSMDDLEEIRGEQLRSELQQFTQGLSGKAFEARILEFATMPMLHGIPNPFKGLRHIRCVEKLNVIAISDGSGRPYKGYKGDSNHRYDVWRLKDGKWKAEVVTTFDAHAPLWQSDIRKHNPTAKKVLSLHQGDCVATGEGPSRKLLRVVKFNTAGQLTLAALNESGSLNRAVIHHESRLVLAVQKMQANRNDGADMGLNNTVLAVQKMQANRN